MWFLLLRRLLVALIAAALFGASAADAQNAPAAQRVFDRARAATGGPGWNTLRGLHQVGEVAGHRYERWTDLVRYGDRTETQTPAGKFAQVYNGAYEWRILADGAVTGSTDRRLNAKVRTDAFLGAYAYFFPSRFDLRSVHLGERQSRGRRYDVLRVQPAGGEPRELWFDRGGGLLGLVVDDSGPRRITTELSDYRRVGPVLIPFQSVTSGGDLRVPEQRRLQSVEFSAPDRGLFSWSPSRTRQPR